MSNSSGHVVQQPGQTATNSQVGVCGTVDPGRVRSRRGYTVLDTICLLIVLTPIPFLLYVVRPTQRGFFCDDDSIRYPYRPNTISNSALMLGGSLPVYTTIFLVEYVGHRWRGRVAQSRMIFGCCHVPAWVHSALYSIVTFTFGAGCCQLVNSIGKVAVGRLRPHFLAVCQPDWAQLNCTAHSYITDYTCTGHDTKLIREARLSFPSGHASFSFFTVVFLSVYLQVRLVRCGGGRLLRPLLQLACLLVGWFVALSRISDYQHHPADVLAGAALGTGSGLLVVRTLLPTPGGTVRSPAGEHQPLLRLSTAPDRAAPVVYLSGLTKDRCDVTRTPAPSRNGTVTSQLDLADRARPSTDPVHPAA